MANLSDYTVLVPLQNSDQPNFLAVLAAFIQGFVDDINMLGTMSALYDLDSAVGEQLDVVGKWIGLSRNITVPIAGVFFSFDIVNVGFDQGLWIGQSPSQGFVALDDDTYRQLLRIKIAANNWDGSLAGAQAVLAEVFPPSSGTYFFIQDDFDMSMIVGVAGTPPNLLVQSLIRTFTLRPAAVNINAVLITSVSGDALFGFDNNNVYIQGFDQGAWGTIL